MFQLKQQSRVMEADTIQKNEASPKLMSSEKKCNYLALIFLIIFAVSCGNISNRIEKIINPTLNEEQMNFCESFFIALQVRNIVNSNEWSFYKIDTQEKFDAVSSLLRAVKRIGFDDVIHTFSIPQDYSYEQKKAYCQSILQDLGLDSEKSFNHKDDILGFGIFGTEMWQIFNAVYGNYYNSQLRQPELKTSLVEILDNGNEVWLVQDYQSMTQARLIVKQNGALNIGNVTYLVN